MPEHGARIYIYVQNNCFDIATRCFDGARAEKSAVCVCNASHPACTVLAGFLNRGEAASLVCTGGSWAELGPSRGGIDARTPLAMPACLIIARGGYCFIMNLGCAVNFVL